jgi:hypothetical protein
MTSSIGIPPLDILDDGIFPDGASADKMLRAATLAWVSLQGLMGGQIGITPVTVRPAKKSWIRRYWTAPVGGGFGFYPSQQADGNWINVLCGHWGDCNCRVTETVLLPGPVGAVYMVQVDGEVVAPSAYRVDNGNELVRQDGGTWPLCPDMTAPDGSPNTFSVTYLQGAAPDDLDIFAASVLAEQFFLRITNAKNCRLPKGVKTISRQGVTWEVIGPMFDNGFTGIPEVDQVIQRRNPYQLKTAPMVMSPDYKPARKTTMPGQVGSGFGAGGYGL